MFIIFLSYLFNVQKEMLHLKDLMIFNLSEDK